MGRRQRIKAEGAGRRDNVNKDEGAGLDDNVNKDEGAGLNDNVNKDVVAGLDDNMNKDKGAGLDDNMKKDKGAGLDDKVQGAGAGLDDKVQNEVVRRIKGGGRRAMRWVKVNMRARSWTYTVTPGAASPSSHRPCIGSPWAR